jgi:hypothetical protein
MRLSGAARKVLRSFRDEKNPEEQRECFPGWGHSFSGKDKSLFSLTEMRLPGWISVLVAEGKEWRCPY